MNEHSRVLSINCRKKSDWNYLVLSIILMYGTEQVWNMFYLYVIFTLPQSSDLLW